jgi:serine/threonine-protein kinase
MFLREARIAACIHHANVVPVLELGLETSGGAFAVMDFIEGTNLEGLVRRVAGLGERVPAPVVLRIMLDLLAGLHACHEARSLEGHPLDLVHRDVSPANVIVGYDGVARLTDFGLALPRKTSVLGRPREGKLQYMAPEQIEGRAVSRTSDVFSAGIILWELLTGASLFAGKSEADTLRRVCREPIPSPRSVDPDITPELEQISTAALERVEKCRFATAADLARALEAASRGAGGIATQREISDFMMAVVGPPARRRRPTRTLQVTLESTMELPASGAIARYLSDAEDTVRDEGQVPHDNEEKR